MEEKKKNNHEIKQEEKYEPLPKKITAFDEQIVASFSEMSQRNNELGALIKQEDQMRMQLVNLKKAIQDLEIEKEFKITDIIVPMGNFQRHLHKEEKGKFIQQHIDVFHTIENQYTGVIAQRKHREDEFNESMMKTLKGLWMHVKTGHKLQDKELFDRITLDNDDLVTIKRSDDVLNELIKKVNVK